MNDVNNPRSLSNLNRHNAVARLADEHCPVCSTVGGFSLFPKGPHYGIRCTACASEHVFRDRGLFWVPTAMNAWRKWRMPQ